MQARRRPVVLMVAEAVTLAHFARIVALADALDPASYDVVVATDPRYRDLDRRRTNVEPIRSISSAAFAAALAAGKPLYDVDTLARYVDEDLATIARVKPDLVVGDFRLSLAVSAPAARVPYAALVNAYWSPHSRLPFPVPDLPLTRRIGIRGAQALFDVARPLAFALHARPLERLRRRHGLASLGHDLRTAYSWGDFTLYADAPAYVPMDPLPSRHRHVGAPAWSANVPLPPWWAGLPADKPVVVVSLGSSGSGSWLAVLLDMLATRNVTAIVATAGNPFPGPLPANAFATSYLPLERAFDRAHLVICNGGSLTTYAALRAAVPVLGICTNMDQLLNMTALERLGAGILLRSGKLALRELRAGLDALLGDSGYRDAAARASERIRQCDARKEFASFVGEVLA